MDPMNASIVKQLSAIRDLYRAIREITARTSSSVQSGGSCPS